MINLKRKSISVFSVPLVIVWVIFLILVIACDEGGLSPIEYKKWVEDENNGLKQELVVDSIIFLLQYTPVDYLVVNEKKSEEITATELHTMREKRKALVCFKLTILNPDRTGYFSQASEKSFGAYHLFSIENDFKLTCNADTIDCLMYQYENHGGISPDCMLIGFSNKNIDINNGFDVVYVDKIMHIGNVVFSYNKETIKSIPNLITK